MLLYTRDGRFSWYVTGDALRSGAWQNVYAVDNVDLRTGDAGFQKCVMHLRGFCLGVKLGLLSGQSIYPRLYMDLWTYRTNSVVQYLVEFAALPADQV